MGLYRVVVEATGGHGCQREKGDGDEFLGCGRMDCPDCVVQEFVDRLNKISPVNTAELIHWPDAINWGGRSVVDKFLMPTNEVKTYRKKLFENGQLIDTGEDAHYVNSTPIRRVRTGYFPDHPSMKKTLPE